MHARFRQRYENFVTSKYKKSLFVFEIQPFQNTKGSKSNFQYNTIHIMLGLSSNSSFAVFVYVCICVFCICIFVFAILTHGNTTFDILAHSSSHKYISCWVFLALSHMLYLCMCVFVSFCICVFVCVWDNVGIA